MKNSFLLCSALLFSATVYAQDIHSDQVPSVVKNTFNRSYPNARDVEWEKKGDLYNAEFDLSRADHEVWIDAKGVLIREKKDITKAQLPVTIAAAIKKQYPSFRVDDVNQYKENKQVFYKVELEKAGKDSHVVFDGAGKVSAKRFD
ncbi:PepSY-like domain-containing protein [Pedobacter psychrodurus]|uniref:PepSY-like domain-containing protein n=1 Tax=Pedobacter psychrodurus TaxID=2530456 RepID=UPI0029303E3F|nr:PepSY-like domain-containing protein [Pedobacter psychrodurus]